MKRGRDAAVLRIGTAQAIWATYLRRASGALGKSAFQGGLVTAALGAIFHFTIAWVGAAVFVLASRQLPLLKTYAVPAELLYGAAVYFFMNFLVLLLSL